MQNLDFYLLTFIAIGVLLVLTMSSFGLSYKYYLHSIKKIQRFHHKEIQLTEAVREQISNDLHDAGASLLTEFRMKLNDLEMAFPEMSKQDNRLIELKQNLAEFSNVLRNTIEDAYPKELLLGHWTEAIQQLAFRYNSDKVKIFFHSDIPTTEVLSKDKANQCFRIIQELITNSVKHALPEKIVIEIFSQNNTVNIIIDSRGLSSPKEKDELMGGRGSIHLKNRLKMLHATMKVENNEKEESQLITVQFNA